MLDMEPGEELAMLQETARKLARDELAPRQREAEASREVRADLRARVREIGLDTLEWPEREGGAELGSLARVLVNEELGAGDAGAALALDPLGPALYPWLEMGGPVHELTERVSGDGARVLLVSDRDTLVRLEGGTVTASVPWVPAARADAVVVLAGDRALLVTEGFEISPLRGAGLRAAGAGALRLESARPSAELQSEAGAVRALARTRLYTASLLLGVLRATCEFSCAYAQQREAFGRPIGHHQALAFLIADMRMALDGARWLVYEAAWRLDEGLPASAHAASAWAQCIDVARSIGPDGVQILGGHGFMADYPVEKHMREARALSLCWGGFDAAVEEAGRAWADHDEPLSLSGATL